MTSEILIPTAACVALFAILFADVALAQQGCFMDCNRAPDKPVAASSNPTPSDQTGAMKKPTMTRHVKRAHAEPGRHVAKP